jgi:putative membrane protein insertion efficiency factor
MIRRWVLLPVRLNRRYLSPYTPPTCRFEPTCSKYAVDAVQVHGVWRGLWFTVRRLLRCHPFGGYGDDPVPSAGRQDPGET